MLLSVEPDGPVPIYQQIRDRIVEAIADGRLPAGSALPSTRQLAVDLGVNFHTVNKAYDLLRQEGLLRLGRKSGAVVRRDAGSGPPDPGWPGLDGPAADTAGRGRRPGAAVRGHRPGMPGRHDRFRLPRRDGRTGAPDGKPAVTAGTLSGDLSVLVVGALACVAPAASRPTLQFGIRVPPERTGEPVIQRERRAYFWRTAAVGACCAVTALALQGHGSWWLPRIILLLELAADFACFWVGRRKIAAVKHADEWFAGLQQTIATDTSWRTDPPRFPVRWLIPALAVIAATAAAGALRYPGLPAHVVTESGHRVPKAAVIVLVVAFQLYVTVLWTGLMLIIYRSRPDIEAADPALSTLRYRRFLAATTRALLTLLALVDTSLLLIALRSWQVYQLPGIGLACPRCPSWPACCCWRRSPGERARAGGGSTATCAASPGPTGPTGTTTSSGKPACSTSTAKTPPSWSVATSAPAGHSTSATPPRGCSSPGTSPRWPAW